MGQVLRKTTNRYRVFNLLPLLFPDVGKKLKDTKLDKTEIFIVTLSTYLKYNKLCLIINILFVNLWY